MKTVTTKKTISRQHGPIPHPNAATKQQLIDRFVELLLAAAIGMGAAATVLFILALA